MQRVHNHVKKIAIQEQSTRCLCKDLHGFETLTLAPVRNAVDEQPPHASIAIEDFSPRLRSPQFRRATQSLVFRSDQAAEIPRLQRFLGSSQSQPPTRSRW